MTKNELTNILKKIWDEKDFITGVQLCLSNDEERQMLADAITAGIIRNGGDIAQYAFCIRKKIPFEPLDEEDEDDDDDNEEEEQK
ncbi:hypothetical protein [Dialister succinatiphilus]|uniref:hypothetical protein n=1 Tax=Dialister succinatiphilus TaxID=487173 RepID=UPI003F8208C0